MRGDNYMTISRALRTATAACLLAAVLAPVPASSRARTVTVRIPKTMARSMAPQASPVVRFDFPATHIVFAWRGPDGSALEYRETNEAGEKSGWIAPGEDDDEAAGGRHVTGVLALDRAVEVEWRAATSLPVRKVEVDYMNTLDGPATTRVVPVARAAAVNAPPIVTRAQWGADESITRKSGSCQRAFAPVQQLFVHHTAGSNSDSQDSAATMRAIHWYHVKNNGWCDIGYNFVVGRDGEIYEGRWARNYSAGETHTGEDEAGRGVIGAHVANYNTGSVGVSLMGNFELQNLPERMRNPLVDFLAWKSDRHGLDPTGKHVYTNGSTSRELHYISGHRDAGSTACPGKNVYRILPEIRIETRDRMGSRSPVDISFSTKPKRIDIGSSATLSGTLVDGNGLPLGGKEVALSRKGGGAWKLKKRLTTKQDGSFSLTVRPRGTVSFRADFAGDDVFRSSSSDVRTVVVRHVVTAAVEGGVLLNNGYTRFPSTTRGVPLYGIGRPKHSAELRLRVFRVFKDGTKKRLRIDGVPLESGEWRHWARLPGPGRYKLLARFNPDSRHALGKSEPIFIRIKRD